MAARDPGAGVDVALGAQLGEGVVEIGREPDQQGLVFHLMSEYITGPAVCARHRGRRGCPGEYGPAWVCILFGIRVYRWE